MAIDHRVPPIPGLQPALHDVDIGSPSGARWVGDAADDPLAIDVREAIRLLLIADSEVVSLPEGGRLATSLVGSGGRSPSLIWHSQCVAALVEVGFLPDAPCLEPHLDAIADRLADSRIIDPIEELDHTSAKDWERREPWVVRARHLAWVVACLSEYQGVSAPADARVGMDHDPWDPVTGRPADVAPGTSTRWTEERYRALLRRAYDGLLGSHLTGPKPARWVSPRREEFELVWHEVVHPPQGQPNHRGAPVRLGNAVTTIYSVLAICRAERHKHTRYADPWHALAHDEQTPSALVDHLLTQVRLSPASGGPLVRLLPASQASGDGPSVTWTESWITKDANLPPSIIALLALILVEYTRFAASLVPGQLQPRVAGAFLKAHRLGQALLARPESADGVLWSRGVDAFFLYGENRAWFTPAYSLCMRAVLETGAATPEHPLVRDAVATIEKIRTDEGWCDLTYHTKLTEEALEKRLRRESTSRAGTYQQHVSLDLDAFADRTPTADWRPRAASIHAAALAYSALRRARTRVDPRVAPRPVDVARSSLRAPAKRLGPCPFTLLELAPADDGGYVATLSRGNPAHQDVDALYSEHASLDDRLFRLLVSIPQDGIPLGKLAKQLPAERSATTRSGKLREDARDAALARVNSLRTAIDRLNIFFGCRVITIQKDATGHMTARLAAGLTVSRQDC